jgi:uncharacterized protein (DUF2225 family)
LNLEIERMNDELEEVIANRDTQKEMIREQKKLIKETNQKINKINKKN